MLIFAWIAGFSVLAWLWLLLFRGRFWQADQRLPSVPGKSDGAAQVVAVIPARNEANTIGQALASVFAQEYSGLQGVIVVDDNSDDGTASAAVSAARGRDNFHLVAGRTLEAGWSGKLWALSQGIEKAAEIAPEAEFILLTDADIEHHRANLGRLVAKAREDGADLVSLMVLLRCQSFWERLLIPAFVFFFQKLFPFAWVNNAARKTAAAAGGCILVRRKALTQAGGLFAIRDQLIDDCALARKIKRNGTLWLGLSTATRSLRAYESLGEIRQMVARTAFEQLHHSALLLVGAVLGMALVYVVPVIACVAGIILDDTTLGSMGAVGWGFMAAAYGPTLRLYGIGRAWGLTLPLAAILYTLFTIDSALRYWSGRGGAWKGRVQSDMHS